jgi:hypothetical protein
VVRLVRRPKLAGVHCYRWTVRMSGFLGISRRSGRCDERLLCAAEKNGHAAGHSHLCLVPQTRTNEGEI